LARLEGVPTQQTAQPCGETGRDLDSLSDEPPGSTVRDPDYRAVG